MMANHVKCLFAAALCMSVLSCSPDIVPGSGGDNGYGNSVGGGAGDSSGNGGNGGNGWDSNDNNQQESMKINIRIGDRLFRADIEDSETGRAFVARLPMTLEMNELNGNEKYCYGITLPRADRRYDTIVAGDIMLYSGNCIVLFYGPAGGYSYTRIGRLQSVGGLAEALGGGKVTVIFGKE